MKRNHLNERTRLAELACMKLINDQNTFNALSEECQKAISEWYEFRTRPVDKCGCGLDPCPAEGME